MNKLSSLLERDESPPAGAHSNLDALVSSPVPPPNTAINQTRFDTIPSIMKTPQTASRLYPSLEEMHPSKVRQSTTKPSEPHHISSNSQSKLSPYKSIAAAATRETPSKSKSSLPNHMRSPTFDFSFERPESDLSAETQKIMDNVREEASKIKAQMLEERSKQENKDGQADKLYGVGGRLIAQPKGKSGRYSDVHKQEFKKMDSIAGHASTWKNKIQANTSALKRSPSKAELDEPAKTLPRSRSVKSLNASTFNEKAENIFPSKRSKQRYEDDTSAARPVSRDTNSEVGSAKTTPAKTRPQSGLPSVVTTPTKASLARSASVKSFKTSLIPSLSRSASTKNFGSPVAPKTEGSNKYLSSLSRFGSIKSILNRPQPKFPCDPIKVAAATHLPLPQGTSNKGEGLPSLPCSPSKDSLRSPAPKQVEFTTTSQSRHSVANASHSPSKIPTSRTNFPSPEDKSVSNHQMTYPNISDSPNITTRTKIPKASAPGEFTFRSEKSINFTPFKNSSVSSPSSTIRHVRPSGISTPLPPFDSLPAIPHGIGNKKRHCPDPDTEVEDDNENTNPMDLDRGTDEEDRHCAKKQRFSEKSTSHQSPVKRRAGGDGSKIPTKLGGAKGKGRKGLSLGRLNMLARPKERR